MDSVHRITLIICKIWGYNGSGDADVILDFAKVWQKHVLSIFNTEESHVFSELSYLPRSQHVVKILKEIDKTNNTHWPETYITQ
jgi:hypothetical protein